MRNRILGTALNPTFFIVVRVMQTPQMSQLTLRKRLLSTLAEEIEKYLPQFEPYSSDYQMVLYACRDLEQWVEHKWTITGTDGVYKQIEGALEYEPRVFRVFLNFWVGHWLEKWRERVRVLSERPKLPPMVLKKIKKARILYKEMEYRRELKKMVIGKLIGQGEICMVEAIAEALIVEEIAKRIQSTEGDSELTIVTPIDILNSLSQRISRIHEEKGPLIHLNIKPYAP